MADPIVYKSLEGALKKASKMVKEMNEELESEDGDYLIIHNEYREGLPDNNLNYYAISNDDTAAIWINRQKLRL